MSTTTYRDRLKGDLLKIAEAIIAEDGLAAVQARRVTGEANCAIGTLYNVFNGLDGLIAAANTRTLQLLGAALIEASEQSKKEPLADRLMALALCYLDFAVVNDKRWRAVFEHQFAPQSTIPDSYQDEKTALFGLVEAILSDAIDDGDDRSSAAQALFSAVHGVVVLALDRKLGQFERRETERQVRFLVTTVARGLTI